MGPRRNSFDVSNTVDTTDHVSVNREVRRIFLGLFPNGELQLIDKGFVDVVALYRGDNPRYRACDTAYHDIQHVMEVALAMARLMDGYERTRKHSESIGPRLFSFGVLLALLHDVGYLRHVKDSRHGNGAQYTTVHVSRGASFLQRYMTEAGMADLATVARQLVHFTGYERPANQIPVPHLKFRLLGQMLGTADIIGQMADRCYLEKCRDRLFPEFVQGGLAVAKKTPATPGVLFASVEDLVMNTPRFYRGAMQRLEDQLGETYRFAEDHFEGQNLYIEEIEKNIEYATVVAEEQDLCLLRRSLN